MGKRVWLLAGLLALTLGSGVVAQSPSPEPPPWFGGRVEMPEHGFAATVPEDWVGLDTTVDEAAQTQVVTRLLGEGWEVVLAKAFSAARANRGQLALLPVGGFDGTGTWSADAAFEVCAFGSVNTPEPLSLGRLMEAAEAVAAVDPSAATPALLDLPAGEAVAAQFMATFGDGLEASAATYLVADEQTVLVVVCGAPDPPDDRWLSIVETVEFLPAEG